MNIHALKIVIPYTFQLVIFLTLVTKIAASELEKQLQTSKQTEKQLTDSISNE